MQRCRGCRFSPWMPSVRTLDATALLELRQGFNHSANFFPD